MRKTKIFLTLLLFANSSFGQTNYENFKKYFQENDTTKIKQLLANWEKTNPNDPELYTSAFNYYFSQSTQEIISLESEQKGKESLAFKDSSGKKAGFINSNVGYNPDYLKKAFYYVDEGIEKFPNRLDIRFGKCFVLGKLENYAKFTNEIIKTVEYSNTIKCNWLWTENKKLDDAENFMLGSIQSYLTQLYVTENDGLLENMKQIGDITIKYYPNCVEVLSTTSVSYMLTKNYDKAIEYLKQAEKVNPKDFIVLSNIAQGYKRKGDKENAIKYYELVLKFGDEQAKQDAKKFIKELKAAK
jgi:tetratricopeptide (TPR) repeat protein